MMIPSFCCQTFCNQTIPFWRSGVKERVVYSKGSSPNRSEGLPEVIAGCASVPISQRDKQNDSIMTFSEWFSACELEQRQIQFMYNGRKMRSFMGKSKPEFGSISHKCWLGIVVLVQCCYPNPLLPL